MVNYLVRLGWSCGDQEIFSLPELVEKFTLENVGKSAGVFNPEKLLWLNAHYIKSGDEQRLGELLVWYLEQQGISVVGGPDPVSVYRSLRERSHTMVEMAQGAAFYYAETIEYQPEAVAKCCA